MALSSQSNGAPGTATTTSARRTRAASAKAHAAASANPSAAVAADEAAAAKAETKATRPPVVKNEGIPLRWHAETPHIGYGHDGQKIMKTNTGDELDRFLSKMDDPAFWRSVPMHPHMQPIELSNDELEILARIQRAQYADPNFDPYQATEEWFTSKTMQVPLIGTLSEPKRRFVQSSAEAAKIRQLVIGIRKGLIVPVDPNESEPKRFRYADHDPWDPTDPANKDIVVRPRLHHLPAPRTELPGHAESYNPPDSHKSAANPGFESMRLVPAFKRFIRERFDRCLDLYLAPRTISRSRSNKLFEAAGVDRKTAFANPDLLLPKLQDPAELEPFPKALALVFSAHTAPVRSIAMVPGGQFALSGSEDRTARLWEVVTGRCLHTWQLPEPVTHVSVNPNPGLCVATIAYGEDVILVNLGCVAHGVVASETLRKHTASVLRGAAAQGGQPANKSENSVASGSDKCQWRRPSDDLAANGGAVWLLHHTRTVRHVAWHSRGDYFITVAPDADSAAVLVHQLSRTGVSQQPFTRSRGLVVQAMFHPRRPVLYLATQRHVRSFDLVTKQLTAKFLPGVKWISGMSVHPTGDHVVISSYDRRISWWDTQLGCTPFKALRHPRCALRSVSFHSRLPLLSSCADDGSVQVFHASVPSSGSIDSADVDSDITLGLADSRIVPVRFIQNAHEPIESIGALSLEWHPRQPWLLSSGADGNVKLWV